MRSDPIEMEELIDTIVRTGPVKILILNSKCYTHGKDLWYSVN